MRHPEPLKTIDLFTGIGGNVLALRGISRPVAYCEIERSRRRVLESLMGKHILPRAPIHTDVRTFEGYDDADMIVGSWPCRGFSTAGPQNGFDHPQSGLFREFAKIVRERKPKYVYQENVCGVTAQALDEVIAAFREDYDISWIVLPAYAVGAPHVRKRWYCLCVRKDVGEHTITNRYERFDWSRCAEPRMTLDALQNLTVRLSMLGNAVVPDASRTAFLILFSGFRATCMDALDRDVVHLARPDVSNARRLPPHSSSAPNTERYHGCTIDGVSYAMDVTIPPKPDLGLVLLPGAYSGLPGASRSIREADRIRHEVAFKLWTTPRGGALVANRTLTRRSTRDLSTQLRFERGTPDDLRKGRANINFIEWIMGFPKNYTLY